MDLLNEILKKTKFKKKNDIKDFSFKTYEESDYKGLLNLFDNVFL